VNPIHVPVLVTVVVLDVEQPTRIVGPLIAEHAAVVIGGHISCVVVRVDALHPDMEAVLPRSQICDSGSVRRDRGTVRVGELKRSSTVMISRNAMTILSGG